MKNFAAALIATLVSCGAMAATGPSVGPLSHSELGKPNGPAQLDGNGRADGLNVMPTGATTARSLAARAADVIAVQDYGAACNATGDDGPAFNAAIAALKLRTAGGAPVNAVLSWRNCQAVIRTTINLTGLRSDSVTIDGSGSVLLGYTAGKPVIDAMHSETLHFRDIAVYGVPGAAEPSIGMQIGRTSAGDPADGQELQDVTLNGSYSFAALYNFGSEVSQFTHLNLNNAHVAASGGGMNCFALVQDGSNHWNVWTAADGGQTAPIETFESFDDNLFTNPQITTSGGCTPMWIGPTNGHKYAGGYASNFPPPGATTPAGYIAVLDNITTQAGSFASQMLDFDNMHFEVQPTDIFYVTGSDKTPVMDGFHYDEHTFQASNSVFKLDPTITSAALHAFRLRLISFTFGGAKVFDNPGAWTVTGDVSITPPGHWTNPAAFNGYLDNAGATTLAVGSVSAGTIGTAAQMTAPGFSTGSDVANGNVNIGLSTGTPYVDYYGIANMRVMGNAAHQLAVQDRALGSTVATFVGATAGNGGNVLAVNGSLSTAGPVGFNGNAAIGKTDITGSCGGNTACQKMAALLISAGLASGTVTP